MLNLRKAVPRSLSSTLDASRLEEIQLFVELLPRHSGALYAIGDLLEGDISRKVGTAMLRLLVNREG